MSLMTHLPIDTDIVSVSAIQLAVTVGPDHWHRTRPQPVYLSLQLHLAPSYLNTPGKSDDVADSLHYGHLAKAVEKCVSGRAGGYATVRALLEDATDAAFIFAREAVGTPSQDGPGVGVAQAEVVRAVRVVVQLPKQILLAGSFEVELITPASDWVSGRVVAGSGTVAGARSKAGAIIRVTNLTLPVLVGVNPPERLAKQRVVTHLTFFEAGPIEVERTGEQESLCDYPAIIQQIVTDVESSSYLTLEKLVYEIIKTAYHTSDASQPGGSRIQAITVRCQKPSALSFADASEVEMTRTRQTL